jgi:hypothetical protein
MFYCDAFISHRREDASAEIVDLLADRGVRAWQDDYADLSDRRVRERVRFALNSSRTVVVCVSGNEAVSHWRRAEYQPGIRAAEKGDFERVIVVQLQNDAVVPEELHGCRRFGPADVDRLATYLLDANQQSQTDEETIRSWVQSRFALGDLPFDEITILGKQRLEVLARSQSDDPLPWEEWARGTIANDLGVHSGGWLDNNPDIPSTTVVPLWDLYRYIGNTLLQREDVLVRLAPYEIVDFVLAPLGWLQTKLDYADEVRFLFASLCLAIAESSDYARQAAAWLVLSKEISNGSSLADARSAMFTAVDDAEMSQSLLRSTAGGVGGKKMACLAKREIQERKNEALTRCRLAAAESAAKVDDRSASVLRL